MSKTAQVQSSYNILLEIIDHKHQKLYVLTQGLGSRSFDEAKRIADFALYSMDIKDPDIICFEDVCVHGAKIHGAALQRTIGELVGIEPEHFRR